MQIYAAATLTGHREASPAPISGLTLPFPTLNHALTPPSLAFVQLPLNGFFQRCHPLLPVWAFLPSALTGNACCRFCAGAIASPNKRYAMT